MKVIKRDGRVQDFDSRKIYRAIEEAAYSVDGVFDIDTLLDKILNQIDGQSKHEVAEIQDLVETELMKTHPETAKAYILYRAERDRRRSRRWDMTELQEDILNNKYIHDNERFQDFVSRVSGYNREVGKLVQDQDFIYAGRILAGRGIDRNVSLSNCYVLDHPEDSLESIFDVAKRMARTYSYGGGVGIDLSNLRPKGAPVNNASKTSVGPVGFMDLYSTTTETISQSGRRGALMLSMSSEHPDIKDFIDIKNDLDKVTHANISIRAFESIFKDEETLDAVAESNWRTGEPGMLFWDRVVGWHPLSHHPDYKLKGTNPCGEQPLPEFGSCNLGSINLSNFVKNPFEDNAEVDYERLEEVTKTAVIGMNEALEDGMDLHPLPEQRETARKYRQIGLGIMGLADMFIKLGIKYGSKESLELSDKIAYLIRKAAYKQSINLVDRYGTYPAYDYNIVKQSEYFKALPKSVQESIKEKGMANSHVLSIAPTGSISTMIGVSGGIEPIFANSFTRTTKSLSGEGDVDYKVYTEVIKELMEHKGIKREKDLPDYCVTSHEVDPYRRIDMQSVWQYYIDSAISSTLNLDESITVEEIKEIYRYAYEQDLKGITVFRNNSFRAGILTTGDEEEEDNVEEEEIQEVEVREVNFERPECPECSGELMMQEGCSTCIDCGWSACSF